jgi:hypothetical protein
MIKYIKKIHKRVEWYIVKNVYKEVFYLVQNLITGITKRCISYLGLR